MTSRAIEAALEAFEIDAGSRISTTSRGSTCVPCRSIASVTYLFGAAGIAAQKAAITWKEAASERLCLLSEDVADPETIKKAV